MNRGERRRDETVNLTIEIDGGSTVSGILTVPPDPVGAFVFAHGAGAGMTHRFMVDSADRLAARSIATLRFQFPFMERGSGRPDPPATAHAAVRAAVAAARAALPGLPLYAGGKSFGGRMTSQAQALAPLDGVAGIAFVGFPLHPDGRPSTTRADHLAAVRIPLLFLQGTRDKLADRDLIATVVGPLPDARLVFFDDADHAFHVRRSSGHTDDGTMQALADALVGWMAERAGR